MPYNHPILLVEGDVGLASSLQHVMEAKGYGVCFCPTGAEAIDAIGRHFSQLAILDLQLPDARGLEILRKLRHKSPAMQFVVLADPGSELEVLETIRAGAFDFATKPVNVDQLLLVVEHAVECARQVHMQSLLAEVSRRLAVSSDPDFDAAIDDVLRLIGETEDVDRAYLFLFSDDRTRMSNTHEWCSPGIASAKGTLQDLDTATFSWSLGKLSAGETVVITDVQSLGDEAAAEREILEAQDILSLVLVPVMSGQRAIGFLGFDAVRSSREWDEFEIGVLQTAAEIIGAQVARLQAMKRLAEHEEQLSLVVEGTPACFFYVQDENCVLTYVSPSVEAITGRPVEEWMPSYDDFLTDNPINQRVREYTEGALRDGKQRPAYLAEIYDKSGRRIMIEIYERPIVRNGKVVGLQGVARDVTEQKRLEAQSRQSQRLEAVGALAGGIAHEFNNLLMGISGYAEILQFKLRSDHPQFSVINDILTCVDRASKVIGQLLAFGRRQATDLRPIGLNELVSECKQLLERLLGEHISVELDLCQDIGLANVDPGQIEQVLVNLAINARDAMLRGGTLTIRTCKQRLDEADRLNHPWVKPGEYANLIVSDTGVGMDEATQDRIFEPFFTTKDKEGHTGLGLAVVYGIIKQHGGYIHVSSEVGKGTTFQVYIPTAENPSTAECEARLHRPRGGSETILLAEDEDTVRMPAKSALEEYGYTVLCASDGEEAVELFKQHAEDVDLAVLDLVMPKAGGRHVWQAISEFRPDLKVLFISGYAASAVHQDFAPVPDMPFLSKPFPLSQLAGKVRELLG